MRNIRLTIEYDGKEFNGWQKQPTKLNIQGNIEHAIKLVTGEDVDLNASGRTDAGVHAYGQVVHFDSTQAVPPKNLKKILNKKIYPHIYVSDIEIVDESFTCNDCNEYDYWWEFSHPNVDTVTMFFNAESFELTLEVRKNA